jgi:hypothetical protein
MEPSNSMPKNPATESPSHGGAQAENALGWPAVPTLLSDLRSARRKRKRARPATLHQPG